MKLRAGSSRLSATVQVCLPPDLVEWLERQAAREGRSVSNFVRQHLEALREGVELHDESTGERR